MIADEVANMAQGERTDLEPSANLQKVSVEDAAKLLNVSERTVHHARAVKEHGVPGLADMVTAGDVSASAASRPTPRR